MREIPYIGKSLMREIPYIRKSLVKGNPLYEGNPL